MALITCKKCKRIVASGTESCPYCGEPDPGATHIDANPKLENARSIGIGFVLLVLLVLLLVQWYFRNDSFRSMTGSRSISANRPNCQASECAAGTNAEIVSSQQQPFYTCKSNELSEYANEVLKVMIERLQLTGFAPEISSKTGEPIVQGSDKAILDQYRQKAQVSSFEEAISKCYRGRSGQKVVVLYSPEDSKSIYVAAVDDQKNTFWMPKSRLVRLSP